MATILAKFKNRKEAIRYTKTIDMIRLLKTDKMIEWIMDAETGEILYLK